VHIQDMTSDTCLSFLAETRFGRIACARDNQPYVTPFSFAYRDGFIYAFATIGKKLEWMRANPLVCIEAEKIVSHREWKTVVVSGRYQELSDTAELADIRVEAHDLLAKQSDWWEPGYVRTIHAGSDRALEPIYFRVSIDEISGHEAVAAA